MEPQVYTADFVVTRDGVEVHRGSWLPDDAVTSQAGYVCSHAARLLRDVEQPLVPCEWCESQGLNGTWQPLWVVVCPNCDEVFRDDPGGDKGSFVWHIVNECGQ